MLYGTYGGQATILTNRPPPPPFLISVFPSHKSGMYFRRFTSPSLRLLVGFLSPFYLVLLGTHQCHNLKVLTPISRCCIIGVYDGVIT